MASRERRARCDPSGPRANDARVPSLRDGRGAEAFAKRPVPGTGMGEPVPSVQRSEVMGTIA